MKSHVGLCSLMLTCMICVGCRHRMRPTTLPQLPRPQIQLDTPPDPETPQMIDLIPATPGPESETRLPETRVKRRHRKESPSEVLASPTPPELPSNQPGSETSSPTPEMAIGALSAGGGDTSGRATTILADLDKRLEVISKSILESRKTEIARIKYFELEAKKALESGDANGAVTLANKAKLLLDAVEQ